MGREQIIGLAIRGRSLQWTTHQKSSEATGAVQSTKLELQGYGSTNFVDLAGEDTRNLTAEIQARCGKISASASAGIPSSRILMRVLDLPAADVAELRDMVEIQVDKFSPFPVDDLSISYELLAMREGTARVLAVAVQRKLAEFIRQSMGAAGIRIRSIDINLLGWWRLLADNGKVHDKGKQAFVLWDEDEADIIVAQDGLPIAFRFLGAKGALTDEQYAAEVAQETAYTLAAIEREYGAVPISSIGIWHAGQSPDALVRAVQSACHAAASCEPMDSLPPLAEGIARRAAARDQTTLDLSLASWHLSEEATKVRRKLVITSIVVACIWLAGIAAFVATIQIQRQKLASRKVALAKIEVTAGEVRTLRQRVQALKEYSDRSHSSLECLSEVTGVQPQGIDLTSFIYKKGKSVNLSGEATAVNLVYDFKKALDQSSLFGHVDLDGPSSSKSKEVFKMTASLPEEAP